MPHAKSFRAVWLMYNRSQRRVARLGDNTVFCERWLKSKKGEMEESTEGAAGRRSQHSDVRIVQSFEYR